MFIAVRRLGIMAALKAKQQPPLGLLSWQVRAMNFGLAAGAEAVPISARFEDSWASINGVVDAIATARGRDR